MDAANKECLLEDGNCLISGEIEQYEYEFIFAPSGLPLSLYIYGVDLKILFNNVIIK